ncbi:hypothetical protein [Streptomyces sp. I05A-00742]|nr:hypothetical protein [Streptomyces sp. I05A-00742]
MRRTAARAETPDVPEHRLGLMEQAGRSCRRPDMPPDELDAEERAVALR